MRHIDFAWIETMFVLRSASGVACLSLSLEQ